MPNLKLSLKLSQQLKLTPQLRQAIKILQLSVTELQEEITKELNENPILEEETNFDEKTVTEISKIEEFKVKDEITSVEASDPRKQEDSFDWQEYFDEQRNYSKLNIKAEKKEAVNYDQFISSSKSLYDHLRWQLSLSDFDEEEKRIAQAIIASISEDGYLKVPLNEIASDYKLDETLLEAVLFRIQEFDPLGVGARNLQECLLIQVKDLGRDKEDLEEIINEHMKDLENRNFEAIQESMNLSLEAVKELHKIIIHLDPKPGSAFFNKQTQYVIPDVYIRKIDGEFVVMLNDEGVPRLRISKTYKDLVLKGGGDEKTNDYIQEKLNSALWFIKSIYQRQKTIYKVVKSILKFQKDFFEKGPEYMKPMILKDVAQDVGIHESTVSRVTTNKYVNTDGGVFELKYFFNSGIGGDWGERVGTESVRQKIKQLIQKEDPKNPLSDQKLTEELEAQGIRVSRRTVSKYRESLSILPSSKRRRYS